MFKKKKQAGLLPGQDAHQLLEAMDKIANGNFEEADVTQFKNPVYAEKINAMLHAFKNANNPVVMRLNETMGVIGDNTLIKDTLDQVETQTKSIQDMESASRHLENSIENISEAMGHIRDNTHEILSSSQNVTNDMNDSIEAVTQSSTRIQTINDRVQDFKGKIGKIEEIVDLVKKVANQSNLLALNASVEAARAGESGKGFAVVADQVRQLSINTAESAEDIVKYVSELKTNIDELATAMEETTQSLGEGSKKVEMSLAALEQMNGQMDSIRGRVDSIFDDIAGEDFVVLLALIRVHLQQTGVTKSFAMQMGNISESYSVLSKDCLQSGHRIFEVGRYLDKTRSDLVRGCSEITQQDWMRVFEVDHYVLTWRVYNNIVGFEHLKKKQVDNPLGCKLGKWLNSQTDSRLTESPEFGQLVKTHEVLHHFATLSWQAKEDGDDKKALSYFNDTYDAFLKYDKALNNLQKKMQQLGYNNATQIVSFEE